MEEYKTYPKGYNKLVRKILPFYMLPMKKTFMRLLLTILTDG